MPTKHPEVDVCFIFPPTPFLEASNTAPPMGLLSLAGQVRKKYRSVAIHDMRVTADPIPDAKIYCITGSTPQHDEIKKIIEQIVGDWVFYNERGRKVKDSPPIFVGGPHATFLPHEVLALRPANVCIGEGELIIHNIILDALERNPGGMIYQGIPAPDLDSLPPLPLDLVDMKKYREGVVLSSRGCPYHCAFCSKVCEGYRTHSVPRAISDFKAMVDQGVKSITFGDDNFGVSPARVDAILEMVCDYDTPFRINTDAHMEPRLLDLAHDCGCVSISFGVESGHKAQLARMRKPSNLDQMAKTLAACKDASLPARIYLVVNFPGENEATVDATLNFVRKTEPDSVLLSSFAPLPGSDTWARPWEYGIEWITREWSRFFNVGKGGSFGRTFTAPGLSGPEQLALHDRMKKGLKKMGY